MGQGRLYRSGAHDGATLRLQESKTTDPSDRIDAHLTQQTFCARLLYAIPECEKRVTTLTRTQWHAIAHVASIRSDVASAH